MALSGEQVSQIHNALLAAYDKEALRLLLRTKLNIGIDEIVNTDQNLASVVLHVILWADRNGRIEDLIRYAAAERPKKAELQQLAHSFGVAPAPPGQTAAAKQPASDRRKPPGGLKLVGLLIMVIIVGLAVIGSLLKFWQPNPPEPLWHVSEEMLQNTWPPLVTVTLKPSLATVTPKSSLATATPKPLQSEEEAVRAVIGKEVTAARERDLLTLQRIYADDAVIINANESFEEANWRRYSGWEEIERRFLEHFYCCANMQAVFDLHVVVSGSEASATHMGTIVLVDDGYMYSSQFTEYKLRKIDGKWLITQLKFNLKYPDTPSADPRFVPSPSHVPNPTLLSDTY